MMLMGLDSSQHLYSSPELSVTTVPWNMKAFSDYHMYVIHINSFTQAKRDVDIS